MSLNTVQPSYALQKPAKAPKAGGANDASMATGEGSVADTVRLSDRGLMMSKLADQMPPTPDNVRKLSAALADDLRNLFRRSAMNVPKSVGFEVDSRTGEVSVTGNSADAPGIAALVGGRPDIGRQIQDISAVSRLLVASERDAEVRQAGRAAQIGAVVADYASRFGGKKDAESFSSIPNLGAQNSAAASRVLQTYSAASGGADVAASISLVFDGTDVRVRANARPWNSLE